MEEIWDNDVEVVARVNILRKGQSWFALYSYYDASGQLIRDGDGMGFPTEGEAVAYAERHSAYLREDGRIKGHLRMLEDADADDRVRRRIAFGIAALIASPCLFRCWGALSSGHHAAAALWLLAAVVFVLDYLGVVLTGGPGHLFEWGVTELFLSAMTSFAPLAFVLTGIHFSMQIMVVIEQAWIDWRADRLAARELRS